MRKILVLAAAVLIILSFGGCGSQKKESALGSSPAKAQADQATAVAYDVKVEENGQAPPGVERKITRNVSLVLAVADVEVASARIREVVRAAGGYVQDASLWLTDGRKQGTMILRVPAEKLDETLPRIEEAGRVEKRNISGKDVTEEYYDASARKAALEKQEKRLLELVGRAGTVKELLEIENELGRVRGQIESLQARIKVLDNLTSLATINIELKAPTGLSTGETLKEPLGQRLKSAWIRGINGMVDVVEGLMVALVLLLPYTPVLGAVGYVSYRVWKKRKTK